MKTRSFMRRLRLPLLSAVFAAFVAGEARAQNPAQADVSRWGTATTGNSGDWSTAANWSQSPPVAPGAPGDVLVFLGAGAAAGPPIVQPTITSNNDFASYTLSQLYLARTQGGTTSQAIPGAGLTADYIITGNALNFVSGFIFNPAGTGVGVTGSDITAASTSGRLQINAPVNFGADTTLRARSNNVNGGEMFFGGPITGSGNLNILAISTGSLFTFQSANNAYTGDITIGSETIVYLGSTNTFGRLTTFNLAGGTASLTSGTTSAAGYGVGEVGYNMQIGGVFGGGQFSVGTNNGVSTVLAGFDNNALPAELTGAGLAGFNSGSHFGKVGTGTLVQKKASASFNAQISVRAGTLTISDDGSLVNNNPNPGAISVYAGGQLRADNFAAVVSNTPPAQGRLSDTAPVRLVGGTLRLDGGDGVAVSEVMGVLRPLAGQSQIIMNSNGSATGFVFAGLDAAVLARGGQLGFAGDTLGTGTTATITGVVDTNGVLPWGLAQNDYVGDAFAEINVTNYNSLLGVVAGAIRPLVTTATNDFSSGTANVLVTGATLGQGTANSLTLDSTSALTLTGPLVVTSGAIMNRNAAGSIIGTGPLSTPGRLYLNTSGAVFTVNTTINAASLSKGGSGTANVGGTINLNDPVTGGPVVSVNGGTLNLAGATVTATATPTTKVIYQVAGGTLAGVPSVNGTLRGFGTVNGPVTLAAGSLLGASSLSSDLGTGAAPGALTVNGALTLAGGSADGNAARLRFYMSSVLGGSFTQGLITVNGTLDLSTAAAGSIAVQPHSINLNNTGNANVYDFDPTGTYSWTMISATTIQGFDAGKFTIDLANFTNPGVTPGQFSVSTIGNNLVLVFNPIPEPALLGLVAVGLFAIARRRKA